MSDDRTPPLSGTPAEPGSAHIGAALAAARQSRGLSVEDVSASTRIRAALVRAIEQDDFTRCGGAVYARGHIKSIAQVVGADGRALVGEFDRRNGAAVPALSASPLPSFEPPSEARRPAARWPSVAIAMLAVAAVFLGVSWFLGRGDGTGGVSAAPSTSPTSVAPRGTTAAPTSPPPKTRPAPSGVTLTIRASTGPSWLLVTSGSGSQVYQGLLGLGRSADFRDGRALTVKFGNSRGVRLRLNGRDVGAPRCDTEVCTVRFLPAGAAAG